MANAAVPRVPGSISPYTRALLYLPIKDTNTHVILPAAPPAEFTVAQGPKGVPQQNVNDGASVFVDETECRLVGEMLKREVCVLRHWLDCALHYHAYNNVSSFLSILQDADYCANTILYSNSDISNQPLAELPPVLLSPRPRAVGEQFASTSRISGGQQGSVSSFSVAEEESQISLRGDSYPEEEDSAYRVGGPASQPGGWEGDWRVLVDAAMAAHHTHAALRARDRATRSEELLKSEEWSQKAEAAAGLPEASARKKGCGLDVRLLMRKDPLLLSLNSAAFLRLAKGLLFLHVEQRDQAHPNAFTLGSGKAGVRLPFNRSGLTGEGGERAGVEQGAVVQCLGQHGTRADQMTPEREQVAALQSAREVRAAEELFRLTAVHTPQQAAPLLGLASCAVYERRWEDALLCYCRLIAYSPPPEEMTASPEDHPAVAALLSFFPLSSRTGFPSAASVLVSQKGVSQFSRSSVTCPRKYAAELRYAAGMCLLRLSRHDAASHAFRRALAIDPTHTGAMCASAVLLCLSGSSSRSPANSSTLQNLQQQLLVAAHKHSPSDASVLLHLAARALIAGDKQQAEGLLRVTQPSPFAGRMLAEQRYLRGWLLQEIGLVRQATIELQLASQLRPNHPATMFRLAQCLLLSGGLPRIRQAQTLLESLLRFLPRNAVARRLLGCAFLAEAEQKRPWKDEEEILDKGRPGVEKKGSSRNQNSRATALVNSCLQAYKRALEELAKAVEVDEEDMSTWLMLARCYEALLITGQQPKFQIPCLIAYERILLLALKKEKTRVTQGEEQSDADRRKGIAVGGLRRKREGLDCLAFEKKAEKEDLEEVFNGGTSLPRGQVPLELLNNMAVLYYIQQSYKRSRCLLAHVLDQLAAVTVGSGRQCFSPASHSSAGDHDDGDTGGGKDGTGPSSARLKGNADMLSLFGVPSLVAPSGRAAAYAAASHCALRQLVAFNLSLVLTAIGAYSSANTYLKELCSSSVSRSSPRSPLHFSLPLSSAWLLRARLAAERGDVLSAKRLCEAAKAAFSSLPSSPSHPQQRAKSTGLTSPEAALTLAEIFARCGKIEAALTSATRVVGLKSKGGERDAFTLTFVGALQRLKARRLLQQQSIDK